MPRRGSQDVRKEKFWRRMIVGQARSGMSISAWCRWRSLREPSFYWWRSRLARTDRGRKAESEKPALIPVRVSMPQGHSPEGCIEILLSGNRRIQVIGPVDRRTLADVLAVLEGAPC
jgi:hypothetical protein